MNPLLYFGWDTDRIISQGHAVQGAVTRVQTWWFLKVNTKPFRKEPLDGATFPHSVTFRYEVNGTAYTGSRVLPPDVAAPSVGDAVTVFYDPQRAERYALCIRDR